jgi:hypothetical protein
MAETGAGMIAFAAVFLLALTLGAVFLAGEALTAAFFRTALPFGAVFAVDFLAAGFFAPEFFTAELGVFFTTGFFAADFFTAGLVAFFTAFFTLFAGILMGFFFSSFFFFVTAILTSFQISSLTIDYGPLTIVLQRKVRRYTCPGGRRQGRASLTLWRRRTFSK